MQDIYRELRTKELFTTLIRRCFSLVITVGIIYNYRLNSDDKKGKVSVIRTDQCK